MKVARCKSCGEQGHYAYSCWRARRLPISAIGKQAKKWIETRKLWFETNPPKAGFYTCYLCGKQLLPEETTLDHVKPRGSNPQLRYDLSNLSPCCGACNYKKGSKVLDNKI